MRPTSAKLRFGSASDRRDRAVANMPRALVTTLKTTSAWLTDEGFYLTDNLSRVRRPKATTTARAPFSQHEVRQLCLAALDTRTGQRDLAIIHLLLDTGMRVGGLCS